MAAAIATTLRTLLRPRSAAPHAPASPSSSARRGAPWHRRAPRSRQEPDAGVTPPVWLRSECFAEDLLDT